MRNTYARYVRIQGHMWSFKGTAIYYRKKLEKSSIGRTASASAVCPAFQPRRGGVYWADMQFWIAFIIAGFLVYLGFS